MPHASRPTRHEPGTRVTANGSHVTRLGRWRRRTPRDVSGILRIGGTILGTTNRGNQLAYPIETSGGTMDYSARCVEIFHQLTLDALVVIGGDGTLSIAHEFSKLGVPLVG